MIKQKSISILFPSTQKKAEEGNEFRALPNIIWSLDLLESLTFFLLIFFGFLLVVHSFTDDPVWGDLLFFLFRWGGATRSRVGERTVG